MRLPSEVVKASLDDEGSFADSDMLDDDEGLGTEHARMQVLDKRCAEDKAKLQQGAATQLRARADVDLAKEGVAAEASALACRAAAAGESTCWSCTLNKLSISPILKPA